MRKIIWQKNGNRIIENIHFGSAKSVMIDNDSLKDFPITRVGNSYHFEQKRTDLLGCDAWFVADKHCEILKILQQLLETIRAPFLKQLIGLTDKQAEAIYLNEPNIDLDKE